MREILSMVIVLTVLSAMSGGLLAALRDNTMEKIEYQKLKFLKAPAVKEILKGAANDPITDKFKLNDGETEISFFVGEFDGKKNTVCFETFGKGYGGDVGLMVGVNLEEDKIVSVGVTTHSETPGLGARAKDSQDLAKQFKGISLESPFKVKNDGGQIDALAGATITSRAVCNAASDAGAIYKRLKPDIQQKIDALEK
ncbi:MAG: RnfABCDGE type electron transport complex subunit G [Thermodesulfobacteriota bacterium]